MTKEDIQLIEKRLASNIYFIDWIIQNYGDMTLRRDKNEIENGEPENLSDIREDLEDIRSELDNI